jgi:FixJ family two-component response regulator
MREAQKVYIIDDDDSIRDGISNLLEAAGIASEGFASAEAFRAARRELAGCILLDARLPGMNGPEFQEELRGAARPLPVIFMTANGDMHMVRKVMKAGAIEFLFKPFQREELLHAVQQAFERDRESRRESEEISSVQGRINSLSERERQVMTMVTAGLLNKQIAGELGLSEITVKLHRRRVMDRMQAGSVAELVKMCERVKFPSWTGKL